MIIVTSISPNHSNYENQQTAIESWGNKYKIYSVNCAEEIELLKDKHPTVTFLETQKTIEYFTGKPLVSINAIIDIARLQWQDLLLINSDIELTELPELKKDGITIFSRYNYKDGETKDNAVMFPHGFDVFHIPLQFLKIFPPSIYGLGASHFDHWIPFHAMLKNIPIYYPEGKFAYHKEHPTQYGIRQWEYIGEYFKWEFKFQKQLLVGQIATMAMQRINNYITKY
jgi:hypothetical protein